MELLSNNNSLNIPRKWQLSWKKWGTNSSQVLKTWRARYMKVFRVQCVLMIKVKFASFTCIIVVNKCIRRFFIICI
jgi:hypothetical protein